MQQLTEHRLAPASGAAPESVVIFLHGLGDSGSGGLLEIGRIWQRALPKTEFLCPDAPFAFDMAPAEHGGRQWFSLREFSKRSIDEGVKNAAPILNAYIDHVLKTRSLKPSRLALVGFSQGTMMALYVGPRRAEPVAAIIGYSGMMPSPETFMGRDCSSPADTADATATAPCTEVKSRPPVLLVHGTADDVVPFAAMGEAEKTLKAAGFSVQTLACPHLAHGIDDAGLETGQDFLRKNGL